MVLESPLAYKGARLQLRMPALPFKLNQDRRHHIPRQQHKVTNWPAYQRAGLRQRGSFDGVVHRRGGRSVGSGATHNTRWPTLRDRHLQCIAETSRRAWQKASGYNKRAKVEASIGRWKQVIGDGLRSRIDERRMTEVNVAVDVLNRMLELGRPNYVRIV